jgi:hypothetical protein
MRPGNEVASTGDLDSREGAPTIGGTERDAGVVWSGDRGGAAGTRQDCAGTEPARRVRSGVLLLLWLTCATALEVLRQPGVPAWDTMWQEDGGVFYTDALHRSLLDALTRAYNGYLHAVPRLLSALAVQLPLEQAATFLAVSSALVVAALAAYVFRAGEQLIPAAWARCLLALLMVLSPVSAYETANNINNLHWYLLLALAFVPFSRRVGRLSLAVDLLVVVLAVLSDSEAVLIAPLFVPTAWSALRRRDLRGMLPGLAVGVCLLVQFVVGAAGQQPGRYASSRWSDLPGIFAYRVAGSLLVGDRYLTTFYDAHGLAFADGCLAVVLVLLVGAALLAPAARRTLAVTTLGAVVFLVVPLMLRGTENFLTRPMSTLNGSRYALLPVLFLAVGLLAAAARLAPCHLDGQLRPSVLPTAVTMLTLTVVAYNYADVSVRTGGPSWRHELTAATRACARTGDHPGETGRLSAENSGGTPAGPADVIVPISPSLPKDIPFAVLVSCSTLRAQVDHAGG